MEMIKKALNTGLVHEIFMKDEPEGSPTRLSYYIEEMNPEIVLKFGENEETVYHVLLEGNATYVRDAEESVEVKAGDEFYCEHDNVMEVTGKGKLFSVIMEKGIRGVVRKMPLKGSKEMKVGEAIGESNMAFVCLNGTFELESEQGTQACEQGQVVFVRLDRKEYKKIKISSEEGAMIVMFQSVKMFDSDFSQVIGVRILEQGYGYCKVRLDIKKEHMNPIGSVHGGAIFTMADEAVGIAASTTGGICTTVDSRIEFLNAALDVKYLTAEAKAKKIGKKIRTFTVDVKDEKERLIASANFVFFCLQN